MPETPRTAAPAQPGTSVSFFHSSFFRAAILVAIASSTIVAAMSLLSFNATRRIALEQLHDQAHGTSQFIAQQLVGAMRFGDGAQIGKVIKDVVDSDSNPVDAALAVNEKGEELAAYAVSGANTAALKDLAATALAAGTETFARDGLMIATPVRSPTSDALLGFIVSNWSPDGTLAALRTSNIKTLSVAAGILLGAMLVTSLLFRRMVSMRLAQINTTMSAIAAGALDTHVPDTARQDEISRIAQSLESFRHTLAANAQTNQLALMRGAALAAGSTAFMLTNNSHEITYANEALVALMRRHAAALRRRNPDFDPERMEGFRADRILAEGAQVATDFDGGRQGGMRIEQDLPSGALVVDINPVLDADGVKIGHVAEWRDVTAARTNAAVTEAIDATQLRAEFLPSGQLSTANEAFCQLLGSDAVQLAGRDFSGTILLAATGEPGFAILARGESVIGRISLAAEGRTLILNGALSPVRDRDGALQRVVMIAADVTETEARAALNRAERDKAEAEQREVVDSLRAALRHLSEGDLTQSIREAFPGDYETLRHDYNEATAKLSQAMQAVLENSGLIRNESGGISRAAEDMSRRTEQQAATLEQTAAALNQLTVSVRSAADRTAKANAMVTDARRDTESSGRVVHEAVEAMGEISESSNKISKITSVIEEISFQTNLLALNAGVEAARAGEAGRGFAVVASEVRALAQRSSEAAREIAGLISASSSQVKRGVDLVGQAGRALGGIQTSVGELVSSMANIAASTTEQSAGLTEINTAMAQLDQVTQQNAAMFEETTAASQALAREADSLNDTMARFRLAEVAVTASTGFRSSRSLGTAEHSAPPSASRKTAGAAVAPLARPSSSRTAAAASPHGGHRLTSLAVKPAAAEDDWEDF